MLICLNFDKYNTSAFRYYSLLPSNDNGLTPEEFLKKGTFSSSFSTRPLTTSDRTPKRSCFKMQICMFILFTCFCIQRSTLMIPVVWIYLGLLFPLIQFSKQINSDLDQNFIITEEF